MLHKSNMEYIEEYIQQLNDFEKRAYDIAKNHLGSSFDIEKSIGYLVWIKEKHDSPNNKNK